MTEPINQPSPAQPIIIQNQPPAGQYFTADQLEAARQQEKDKLYKSIEGLKAQVDGFKTEVDTLRTEREAAQAAKAAADQAAADAARKESESRMSVQELIAAKEKEWGDRFSAQNEEIERTKILMQHEREYQSLRAYIQRRVAEEIAAATIADEFLDYIDGNNEAEVEAAITKAKDKTASIVAIMQGQTPPARSVPQGVSPTGNSPSGPLDNLVGQKQYSLDELKSMGREEYKAFREKMGIDRAGNDKGMFG